MNSNKKIAKINGVLKSLDSDPLPNIQNGDDNSIFNDGYNTKDDDLIGTGLKRKTYLRSSDIDSDIVSKIDQVYKLLPKSDSTLFNYHSINNTMLKTYCNPRVFTRRNNVIESFSLPDVPPFLADNVENGQLDANVVDVEEITVGKYQDFDEPWILKSIKPNGEFSDCETDIKKVKANSDSNCHKSPEVPIELHTMRKPSFQDSKSSVETKFVLNEENTPKVPTKRSRNRRLFENVDRHLRSSGSLDLFKEHGKVTVRSPEQKPEHRLLRSRSQELVKDNSKLELILDCESNNRKKQWNSFPSNNPNNKSRSLNSIDFTCDDKSVIVVNGHSSTPKSGSKPTKGSAVNGFKVGMKTWRGIQVPKGKGWSNVTKTESNFSDNSSLLTDNSDPEVSFSKQPNIIDSFTKKRGRPRKSIVCTDKRTINSVDLTGDLEVSFNSYGKDNTTRSDVSWSMSQNESSISQGSLDVEEETDVGKGMNGSFLSELFVKITRSQSRMEFEKDITSSPAGTSDRMLRSRSSLLYQQDVNLEVKEENSSFLETRSLSVTPEKKKYSIDKFDEVPIKYEEGSIMWAQLGKYPYWPCIIIKDKEINQYKKDIIRSTWRMIYYHVIFFGDHKRAWVNEKKLMRYVNSDDLKQIYQCKKNEGKTYSELKVYTIKTTMYNRWLNSVKEAEICKRKRDKEKMKYVEHMLKPIVIEDTSDNETEKRARTISKHRLSEPSLPLKKKLKVKSENAECVDAKDEETLNNCSIKEDYVAKTEESPDNTLETLEMKPKRSSISLEPITLQSQKILFRRNNLFRGVPKERACQYCSTHNKVLKCRGCFIPYHMECAKKVFLNEPFHLRKPPKSVVKLEKEATKSENVSIGNIKEESDYQGKHSIYNLYPTKDFPDICQNMSVIEKLDYKLEELMKPFANFSIYCSPEELEEDCIAERGAKKTATEHVTAETEFLAEGKSSFRHVTADSDVSAGASDEDLVPNPKNFKCGFCTSSVAPYCMACHQPDSRTGSMIRQKCSQHQCGRYYHPECLKQWPQTQWSLIQKTKHKDSERELDNFICPSHVCHTCVSGDPRSTSSHCPPKMVARCVRCPSTYHSSNFCVPAGSRILSASQIICPRHRKPKQRPVNTTWCFLCSEGGDLFCCEFCPTSVHAECMPVDFVDGKFICEDCQSGRMPLYDEVVWVKLGAFKWWPSVILFPNEVPPRVMNGRHSVGDFVVMFFGTYDHRWVNRSRTFLFQEGDEEQTKEQARGKMADAFMRAVEEASAAHKVKIEFRALEAGNINGLKPPPYIKLKVNKPVGNVRQMEMDLSNTTPCECDPNQPNPCGPDSNCLNRLLLTECNPEVCPAGKMCNNQSFEKREYPLLTPYKTDSRGWGLKTLAPIKKGQFIIEYVGEVIDDVEYQRRIQKMHEQKESNYYFLIITKDRMIDAGPKGNMARFMNHCCQPNCETQKWTVNGDTRVGLFATDDIPAGSELTFNYNLECIGEEKKICKCGAPNCSGFIGVKAKQLSQESQSEVKKPKKAPKKKKPIEQSVLPPCFVCGRKGKVGLCNNKSCSKAYHLKCLNMTSWPEGNKFICSWHNCNICSKRTIRCCFKCVNSYCPSHSKGNIRHDTLLGFVCSNHDVIDKSDGAIKTTPKGTSKRESNDSVSPPDKSNDSKSDEASTVSNGDESQGEDEGNSDCSNVDDLSLLERVRPTSRKTEKRVKNQSTTANIGLSSQS